MLSSSRFSGRCRPTHFNTSNCCLPSCFRWHQQLVPDNMLATLCVFWHYRHTVQLTKHTHTYSFESLARWVSWVFHVHAPTTRWLGHICSGPSVVCRGCAIYVRFGFAYAYVTSFPATPVPWCCASNRIGSRNLIKSNGRLADCQPPFANMGPAFLQTQTDTILYRIYRMICFIKIAARRHRFVRQNAVAFFAPAFASRCRHRRTCSVRCAKHDTNAQCPAGE